MELTRQAKKQLEKTLQEIPAGLEPLRRGERHKLAGDASTRVYVRITAKNLSCIAMIMPPGEHSSVAEEITKSSKSFDELPFLNIQRFLKQGGVRAPDILHKNLDQAVLLLEDFGDRLLLFDPDLDHEARQKTLYQRALRTLFKIVSIPISPNEGSCIAAYRSFDRDLYNWEFHHFVEYGVEKNLPDVKKDELEKLEQALFQVSEEYLRWPRYFTHRDYHSRNLHILEEGEIGVIDFQDALLAPLHYDLASLLKDSYFEVSSSTRDELVFYYRDLLKDALPGIPSRDEFLEQFHLMSIHRNLKAAGRFFYIDCVKENPDYLKDIPRTLRYVRDSLETCQALSSVKKQLLPLLPEIISKCPKEN